MDHRLLATIEHPDRDSEFFRILHRAAESMVTLGTIGYTRLGIVPSPDYVAEMADMFQRLEKIEWMLCTGIFKKNIFYSIRSKNVESAGKNAESIAGRTGGSGGGHGMMGAGRIPLQSAAGHEMFDYFIRIIKENWNLGEIESKKILPQ